ncbi:XRCC4-like factor-domain-containing protein [Phyllosticta citriasiana]|uniref:Non-homologous end-joining factor 1 n=1 Tax=Phyllosticta citriasiana TaxID=595635 RepID=A0ABR1KI79_9PEZI
MVVPWTRLKSDSLDSDIRLYVKPQFFPSSYTVLISDLCHIWEESLDRKQILRRALELDTSIDPTEDSDQLHLLLEKINAAFHGSTGTSVQLAHRGPDLALQIRLITPLPAPLEDLKWEMVMAPSPEVSVKEHLTLPLIAKAQEQRSQIDDLIGHLSAKDHVITKLLDKLEGTGFDLSSVFPGIAGTRGSKHSTPREQVALQVHGVGAFDAEKWRSARKFTSSTDDSLILSEIGSMQSLGEDENRLNDVWLSKLPVEFEQARREPPVKRSIESQADNIVCGDSRAQDEEFFERQETPPHLRKTKPNPTLLDGQPAIDSNQTNTNSTEDDTMDDDDLDGPPKKASQSRPKTQSSLDAEQQESQTGPRRLGKLEGARKTSSSPEITQRSSQAIDRPKIATSRKLGKLGGPWKTPSAEVPAQEDKIVTQKDNQESETETEDEADLDPPEALESNEHERPAAAALTRPPPKREKLGKIGGGKKTAASPDASALRPDILSGSHMEVDGVESARTGERGSLSRLTRSTPSADEPHESEAQRANRKREELKLALEFKPPPAKKKRRF